MSRILGGMQLSGTFEWQPGPLLDWGNVYYYGNLAAIKLDNPTLAEWFNNTGVDCKATPGAATGFDRCAARGPDSFQARVFPQRLPGIRKDYTLQTNANVQREFTLYKERVRMFLRFDVLNAFNRSQFDGPSTDPNTTNFGRVTAQTAAINRFLQFQARIQY
jgi:hypothetical protein